MFELTRGNLLEADVEAVVNTVNTEGIMGKGIALQFRKAYPENYEAYRRACKTGEVQPGRMFVFDRHTFTLPRYIINFPTKHHWKGKSRIEYIESGLKALIEEVRQRNIHSIAIPPLGCGLGGLEWDKVRPMIEDAFHDLPGRVRLRADVADEGAAGRGDEPSPELSAKLQDRNSILLNAVSSLLVLIILVDMIWKPGA
jgi:O-acetyl-ADP-ribose deacetylase (regulator of RNase III)